MAGVLAPLARGGSYASSLCRAAGKHNTLLTPRAARVFLQRAYSRSHEDLDNLGGYDKSIYTALQTLLYALIHSYHY